MPDAPLVRTLPEGPLDLVGDVHGELDALRSLLEHLGYEEGGGHPAGRRLVFLGDLVDRGPDSPAVVRLVAGLVGDGGAACVLGNHELNLLLGLRKEGNAWFYGEADEVMGQPPRPVPQRPADARTRARILAFFRSLPLALERADLRAVHAAWDRQAVEQVRGRSDAVRAARDFKQIVEEGFRLRPPADDTERKLALQNGNPVRVLTSGPERRLAWPSWAGGRPRREGRVPWWEGYGPGEPFCVFGHYWRVLLPGEDRFDGLFDDARPHAALGRGATHCAWTTRSASGTSSGLRACLQRRTGPGWPPCGGPSGCSSSTTARWCRWAEPPRRS
jgi:hypothetical protein